MATNWWSVRRDLSPIQVLDPEVVAEGSEAATEEVEALAVVPAEVLATGNAEAEVFAVTEAEIAENRNYSKFHRQRFKNSAGFSDLMIYGIFRGSNGMLEINILILFTDEIFLLSGESSGVM
jgi:hypothetical protein